MESVDVARFTLRFLTGMVIAEFALGALAPAYVQPYSTGVGQVILLVASAAFVGLLIAARQGSLPRRPTRFLAGDTEAPDAGLPAGLGAVPS